MKKLLLYLFTIITTFSSTFFVSAHQVLAASCGGVETSIINCSDDDGKGSSITDILKLVVNILSVGVGVLGVIGIMITGIQYLTAGGSEEKTRKAKRRMFEIILGLLAYALIYAAMQWLMPGWNGFGG